MTARGQGRKIDQERVRVKRRVEVEMAKKIFFVVGKLGKNQQQSASLNPCCFSFEGSETGAVWTEAEEVSCYLEC